MSDFSLHFCQECSDSLQNYRSWGSILFLKGAVFSVLTEASRVTQTGKRRSKEGWFCSRKSRSDWFLMFLGRAVQRRTMHAQRYPGYVLALRHIPTWIFTIFVQYFHLFCFGGDIIRKSYTRWYKSSWNSGFAQERL